MEQGKPDLASLRKNYALASFGKKDADENPFVQFENWFSQALECGLEEPNAMSIATVGEDGMPSSRMVLLKGLDERGFVFFTNYDSRKGKEIAHNAHACLLFFWADLQRQVRIEGQIEKISALESETYYLSRPEGSRLGAWASPQSKVIPSRQWLEAEFEKLDNEKALRQKPPHWGGYRLLPSYFEFWQGRPNRLHDRICYKPQSATWSIYRLAP